MEQGHRTAGASPGKVGGRAWTSDELTKIGTADELRMAGRRRDGTLRNPVTIWGVRHDASLYVRSVNGRNATWFRGAQVTHAGRYGPAASRKMSRSWSPTRTSAP